MTILEKLKAIEQAKTIYNIHYCRAGVGFCFYDPEKDPQEFRDRVIYGVNIPEDTGWTKALTTDKYYSTFEEAVEAEYERLPAGTPAHPKNLVKGKMIPKKSIYIQEGDGIEIDGDVKHLYHKCCECGCEHLVTVGWVNNRKSSVILRWYPYPKQRRD